MIKSVRSASIAVLICWYLMLLEIASYLLSDTETQIEPRAYRFHQETCSDECQQEMLSLRHQSYRN